MLVFLSACSGPAPCDTPECRISEVESLWEQDQAAATEALVGLSPQEQSLAAAALIAQHPEAASSLCEALPEGQQAEWCSRVERRPHLWTELPERADDEAKAHRTAPGPPATSRLPALPVPNALTEVPASAVPCPEDKPAQPCRIDQASRAARDGNLQDVAAACHALERPEWVGECFFRSAEAAAIPRRAHRYQAAARLCGEAEQFSANCYWHTAMAFAQAAPPADLARRPSWQGINKAANAIQRTWSPHDPDFGLHMQGFLWGRATSEAMAKAQHLDGTALAYLPGDAVPHLRAALAAESLRRDGAATHDLEGWVAELKSRLEQRQAEGAVPSARQEMGVSSKLDHWPLDEGQDGAIPAVLYLGGSRRTLSQDVDEDLAICVLEGAARMKPPATELIEQGVGDERVLVDWTARRLLASLAASSQ